MGGDPEAAAAMNLRRSRTSSHNLSNQSAGKVDADKTVKAGEFEELK